MGVKLFRCKCDLSEVFGRQINRLRFRAGTANRRIFCGVRYQRSTLGLPLFVVRRPQLVPGKMQRGTEPARIGLPPHTLVPLPARSGSNRFWDERVHAFVPKRLFLGGGGSSVGQRDLLPANGNYEDSPQALLASGRGRALVVPGDLGAWPGDDPRLSRGGGAGKFAFGGRGGDVYVVTNLNNTGAGSLRNGITSATGPRIIVFGVSGTINLTSDLSISSKSKITIAGQTAPEGGITLKGRGLRVNNSTDVVVQHLRVRPGDINTADPNGNPNGYAPDSVSVTGSHRVVLDHISASWSTDEVLSVTDFSDNVSVQWSMISEALHQSNHPEGNHGYGSLLCARDISFHHNLYAHNWSRNPRPGTLDSSLTNSGTYDFVNNVISNPGDKYGYSTNEDIYLNWVANYGIRGPDTDETYLFSSGGIRNRIYERDNYRDDVSVFNVIDGAPSAGFTIKNDYTTLTARQPITEIGNETTAPIALQQVLSYVGALSWRDAADKRVIGNVFNQNGAIIDSQNEVGGWPTLPSSTVTLDPDGLPDWWKTEKGLDPDNNTIGLQLHPDGSGYTYLEKYLHELNVPYLPRTTAPTQVVISTAFGAGADAQVSENFDLSSGVGDSADLNVTYAGALGDINEYCALAVRLGADRKGDGGLGEARADSLRQSDQSHGAGLWPFARRGLRRLDRKLGPA